FAPRLIRRPLLRQIETPIDHGMPLDGAIIGENPNLAVVGPPQGAGVLPLDTDRLVPLLGEAGFVRVELAVGVSQLLEYVTAHLGEYAGIVPAAGGDERLEVADVAAGHGLGDVLAVAAFAAIEQPLDKELGVLLVLRASEQRSVIAQEAIQLGLQLQQFLLGHETAHPLAGNRQ